MVMRSHRAALARSALVLVLFAAFALRLFNLTYQPLWFDEGWSVWFATSDLATMAARTAVDIHPPLYYALLHFWIGLSGTGEFALRMFSVLAGMLIAAVLFKLADSLLGRRAAWLAVVLAAVSPLQVYYAQEIRMYGLVTLLGIVSSWLFWAAMQKEMAGDAENRRRTWAAYVVVTSAAVYTEYYGAFIPLFHAVYWLCLLFGGRRSRRALISPLVSFVSLFVIFLPWLIYAGPRLVDYVGNKVGIEQYDSLALGDYVLRHLVAFSAGHLAPDVAWLGAVAVICVALALWGALGYAWPGESRETPFSLPPAASPPPTVEAQRTGHPLASLPGAEKGMANRVGFLLLYLIVPVVAGYLVQLRFPFAPPRMERLLLLASPPFIILVANGLQRLDFGFQAAMRRLSISGFRLKSLGALSVLAVVLAAWAISLASFYTVPRYPEQDYRALADRINALALPSDVVVCVHPWQVGFLQAYLQVPAALQLVADPAWGPADQAELDGALSAGQRIWLPAYQTLGRILETAMENHLAQKALTIDAKWYEQTRLSFYTPAPPGEPGTYAPLSSAVTPDSDYFMFDPRLALGRAVQLDPRQAGWDSVPLYLRWTLKAPVEPLGFSLRLVDQAGQLWAEQEREPFMGAQPMSGWALNTDYVDRIAFLVPAGLPPGAYALRLVVYRASDGQQLGPEATVGMVPVVRPALPPPVGALPIQTALSAEWPGAKLLGYTLQDGTWRAGDRMHVDLFWQARGAVREDGQVFVQVQDLAGSVYALSQLTDAYPPAQWQPGDLIHEQRDLTLPATLPAGRYRVVAGLLRSDGRTRVPLAGGGDQVVLREFDALARPHQMTPPAMQVQQPIRFGGLAQIAGYDFTQDTGAKTLRVRLYWQALSETQTSYKVFVHVVAPGGQSPAAQHDSVPANGDLPTTAWVHGEYITDEHVIALPDLPAGPYRVLVGLYDPQSGVRLPALAADGHEFANDAGELLEFQVGR